MLDAIRLYRVRPLIVSFVLGACGICCIGMLSAVSRLIDAACSSDMSLRHAARQDGVAVITLLLCSSLIFVAALADTVRNDLWESVPVATGAIVGAAGVLYAYPHLLLLF